VFSLKLKSNE
jgi:hypothetical protein